MGSFGVRSYLFGLLGVSTALPVALFGLAQAEHHARDVSRRHDETLLSSSATTAHRVGDFFAGRKQDLETLAAAVAANGALESDTNRQLLDAHFRISGVYAGTYLGNAEGTPLVRASPLGILFPPGGHTNYRDRDYFQGVIRDKRTVFSRAQTGKMLGEPSVQVATPIVAAGGRFLGYAEGSLDLARLKRVLIQAQELGQLQITLVDATGHVVLDTQGSLSPLTDVSREELFALHVGGTALRTASHMSRIIMRGAVVEVPGMPQWHVLAAQPESIIQTLVEQERRRVWWAAGIAGAAALLISAGLSTWLARRFRHLADQLKTLGEDAVSQPPEPTPTTAWEPREFQSLQHQIALLAQELTTHRRGLEEKVAARTAELAQTNERLNFLVHALERAEDGIAITNDAGQFLYVNPALESITGYRATELLQHTASELHLDPTEEATLTARKRDLAAGNSHQSTFAARRKDGSLFEQECTTWPIPDTHGQPHSYVTLRKDVTSLRRTEQSLRLSERMASLGTLAAGVAHEINNPLTYVLLSLRLVQRQLDRYHRQLPAGYRVKTASALDNAVDGAERVSEIVKDLRVFSRADETTVTNIDPQAVIESALRLMGNDIRHRARIERDYRSAPEVTGNHARLHQVFLNLFINATHAIEEAFGPPDASDLASPRHKGPQIRVTTDTDANGDCVIEVSDTGVGIAAEHLDKVFDPFFTTKPVGVGTGLGLAMCRNIITSMAGEITVRSEVGLGTTFRILLPRARSASSPSLDTKTQRRARLPSARILIVDDNRSVADSVSAVLSEYHRVDVANDARTAIAQTKHERYQAIFCDLRMPHMNGVEFFRALATEGRGDEQRVIFFTGGPLSEGTRSFLQLHSRPCLAKPISEEQLEKALREVLQEHFADHSREHNHLF